MVPEAITRKASQNEATGIGEGDANVLSCGGTETVNQELANLTMAQRRELVRQIESAHSRGIRLDPRLVAEAKDSLILRKSVPKPIQSDEPTKEQLNRMLVHFGKEPIK